MGDRLWTSVRMGFLFLLVATSLAGVHGFGLGPSLEWKAGDAEMWDQVPEIAALVSSPPPSKVFVEWPSNLRVDLNASVGVGRMQERPRLVWPFPMAGINDMPECKPKQIVMDITVDSPNLDKRELYAYWHSPFSPYSILTAAKDLYPTWTTGKVEDFSAKSGSYNAPYLTENQADTLSGVFDATFLEYPKDKAKELFERIVELVPSAPQAFSSGAYAGDGKPFKIILAEANNQDWDFTTVLNKDGMVMEMFMVKMFEGKEEQHHKARAEFIALTRNLNDVIGVYTFEVDQEILEPSDPFYYDSTNNEIMIVVYPSAAARNRAQGEMYQHAPDVFGRLSSSFECVMCAVLEINYHPF